MQPMIRSKAVAAMPPTGEGGLQLTIEFSGAITSIDRNRPSFMTTCGNRAFVVTNRQSTSPG